MSNGTITMTGAEYDALAGKIAALEAELAQLRAELAATPKAEQPPVQEPVAEVVSGYSGDPDTRGSKRLKELDLSTVAVGDKLYAAPQPVSDDVAQLKAKNDLMTECADSYSRMFEECSEECEHLKDCQENAMLHMTGIVSERETLRQQRDLLAGLLRMVRQDGWYHPLEEHEIAQIDAALAEVDK